MTGNWRLSFASTNEKAKREVLLKTKPLVQPNGKAGTWRHESELISWLEAL
jgi:hypothetical protein